MLVAGLGIPFVSESSPLAAAKYSSLLPYLSRLRNLTESRVSLGPSAGDATSKPLVIKPTCIQRTATRYNITTLPYHCFPSPGIPYTSPCCPPPLA